MASCALLCPALARGQTAAPQAAPAPPPTFTVEVIETTPLPGLDLRLDQIPAPVQSAIAGDIDASSTLDLSDFLNRRFTSVFVNEMQGNPFQPDINYRDVEIVAAIHAPARRC